MLGRSILLTCPASWDDVPKRETLGGAGNGCQASVPMLTAVRDRPIVPRGRTRFHRSRSGRSMSTTTPGYARVNWDQIPDNGKFPRHAGYRHPWATDDGSDYQSRDLDGPLGLQEMSVVWVRIGP